MATTLGRPQIIINFRSRVATALNRSGRGVGVIILNDENIEDRVKTYQIVDSTDIPKSGLTDKNIDLIKKALLGTSSRLFIYVIPPKTKTVMGTQEIDDDFEI